MDESANKLKTLQCKLEKLNEEVNELQESTNVDSLKANIKEQIEERNKLEEYVSEVEEKVKILQEQSSLNTELEVQKNLKSTKDSQFRK